jgi:hypothetical protein
MSYYTLKGFNFMNDIFILYLNFKVAKKMVKTFIKSTFNDIFFFKIKSVCRKITLVFMMSYICYHIIIITACTIHRFNKIQSIYFD